MLAIMGTSPALSKVQKGDQGICEGPRQRETKADAERVAKGYLPLLALLLPMGSC